MRNVDLNLRYVTSVVDAGSRQLLAENRKVEAQVHKTDRALKGEARAMGMAKAAAGQLERAEIGQRKSALGVEKAELAAGKAAQKHGRDSLQARSAAVQLEGAQNRLKTSTDRLHTAQSRKDTTARDARAAAGALRGQEAAASSAARSTLRLDRAQSTAAQSAQRQRRASAKTGGLQGARDGVASRTAGAGTAVAASAGLGLGAALKAGIDYEAQMDAVRAVAGATTAEMRRMDAQALKLGADTKFSASQAAAGMYELATAGFDANRTMKILPGTLDLAAATRIDLAEAAKTQAVALRGFGLGAEKATYVADAMTQAVVTSAISMDDLGLSLPYVTAAAKATGTSFEEVTSMAGLLGNAGISGEKFGTAIRASMLGLTNPSDKAANALRSIGLDAKDLAGIPLPQAIGKIAANIDKLPGRGEKLGLIATVFGREAAPAVLTLLEQGEKKINAQTRALANSEGQAKKTAKVMQGNLKADLEQLGGAVEATSIKLGRKFDPALRDVTQAATSGVKWLGEHEKTTAALGITAGTAVSGLLGLAVLHKVVKWSRSARDGFTALRSGMAWMTRSKAGSALVDDLVSQTKPMGSRLSRNARGARAPYVSTMSRTGTAAGQAAAASTAEGMADRMPASMSSRRGRFRSALRGGVRGIGVAAGAVIAAEMLAAVERQLTPDKWEKATKRNKRNLGYDPISGANSTTEKIKDWLTPWATGGRVRRFAGGGYVDALVSPGEVIEHQGASYTVPGARVAADSVRARLPVDSFVLTDHGQALRSQGMGLDEIEGRQVPHFAGGGLITNAAKAAKLRRPDLLYGVWGAESNFSKGPGPTSRAGAQGPFQLMPATARSLGVNPAILGAAARGAAKYLATYQGRGVPGMLAAYNAGPGRKPPYPAETQAYIPKVQRLARGFSGGREPSMSAESGPSSATLKARYDREIKRNMDRLDRLRNALGAIAGRSDAASARRDPLQDQIRRLVAANRLLHGRIRNLPKDAAGRTAAPARLRTSPARGGLVDDAFGQGLEAGRQGVSRAALNQANPVIAAIREAMQGAGTQPDRGGSRASLSRSSAPSGPAPRSASGRMIAKAAAIDAQRYQYSWGGGHGRIGVPTRGTRTSRGGNVGLGYDCSGAVSAVLNAGGLLKSPLTSGGLMGWGKAGAGKRLAVVADPGHTIMRVGSRWFGTGEQNREGGAGWLSGNTMKGRGATRTWPGLRRGGLVGFRSGGTVAKRTAAGKAIGQPLSDAGNVALGAAAGSMEIFDAEVGKAASRRVAALRRLLAARVRKGGDAKLIGRMRQLLSVIDFELGRRTGEILRVVASVSETIEGNRARGGRALRARGVDEGSAAGIQATDTIEAGVSRAQTANRGRLLNALKQAQRAGNRDSATEIRGQLKELDEAIAEGMTTKIERARALILAQAQDRLDLAGSRVDLANTGMQGLEVAQRAAGLAGFNGGADSPAAMRARAARMQQQVVPAMQANRAALAGQVQALNRTGDKAGARAAYLQWEQMGVEISTALVDAAELIRAAGEKAAQEIVDTAQFDLGRAQSGMADLDLAQRAAGLRSSRDAADQPGSMRARAASIQGQLVPQLERVRDAYGVQAQAALARGDRDGWRAADASFRDAGQAVASALLDAGELVRDASLKAAAQVSEDAAYGSDMADIGLRGLELGQELRGETGAGAAQAQSAYITDTIIPGITAQLAAKEAERAAAVTAGDEPLARSIAKELAQLTNSRTEAQIDATKRVKDAVNAQTEALKAFGGSISFEARGQNFTDLISVGLGA